MRTINRERLSKDLKAGDFIYVKHKSDRYDGWALVLQDGTCAYINHRGWDFVERALSEDSIKKVIAGSLLQPYEVSEFIITKGLESDFTRKLAEQGKIFVLTD